MTIIREKTHSRAFVILHKAVLEDINLSFRAKGLWAYLMSLPDDWKINSIEVSKHATDGRDSVRSALHELVKHGYAEKIKQTKCNGQYVSGGWKIFETKKCIPQTDNPSQGIPAQDSESLLSTKELRNKRKKETKAKKDANASPSPVSSNESASPPPVADAPPSATDPSKIFSSFGSDRIVKLTTDQLNKLHETIDPPVLRELIEELNDYISSTGKKYKCHAATLRAWNRRRRKETSRSTRKGKLAIEADKIDDGWVRKDSTPEDFL